MAKKNNQLNLNSLTSQLNPTVENSIKIEPETEPEIVEKIDEIIEQKINVKTLKQQDVKTLSSQNAKALIIPTKTIKHRKTIYLEEENLKILKKLEFERGKDMSFYVNQIIAEWDKKLNK
jgi:hypothetical protein